MNLSTYFMSNDRADSLKTELLFRIATARAENADLIRLDISGSEDDRDQIFFRVKKILKAEKTAGTVKTYAFPADFEKNTTEADYLLNLYPEIKETVDKPEFPYIFIKI